MNIKRELFDQLSASADETQFIQVLTIISNELNKKGFLLEIKKKQIIDFVKDIRIKLNDKQRKVWTKKVASIFGQILKQLNKASKLESIYSYSDSTEYGFLQKFGQLNSEEFSKNRIINNSNFLNDIHITNVECGGKTCVILTSNGDIYTCGRGSFGQLGHGNKNHIDEFKKVENIPQCKYISSGYAFTSAISVDGDIYSWGAGENGRLGTGNEENTNLPIKLEADVKFKVVESGSVHQCAISENNELYSCGDYKYNGDGLEENKLFLTKNRFFNGMFFNKISIGPGGYHTLALNIAGNLFAWGHNRVGQLGLGNTSGSIIIDAGDHINPIPSLIKLFNNKIIIDISCGWGHSAVITNNHDVYMCGRNVKGQLGIDPNQCQKNTNGFPYISEFTRIDSLCGININKIECGGEHSAAITKNGILYVWGDNSKNKLGNNDYADDDTDNDNDDEDDNDDYCWEPAVIDTSPYIGKVVSMALGSDITYLLTQFD